MRPMSILNKKIFSNASSIFGLDLSDLSVKLIKFEDNGREKEVASYGCVQLPVGAISDGEIKKKEQVVDAIKKLIEISGPKKIKTRKKKLNKWVWILLVLIIVGIIAGIVYFSSQSPLNPPALPN